MALAPPELVIAKLWMPGAKLKKKKKKKKRRRRRNFYIALYL
jgi:hypothetical protein